VIKEKWNNYHWKIIREIKNPELSSDVAALIMDEGVAHLCFVQHNTTVTKAKIKKSVPKKRQGASKHDKAMVSFFTSCVNLLD